MTLKTRIRIIKTKIIITIIVIITTTITGIELGGGVFITEGMKKNNINNEERMNNNKYRG